MNEQSDPANGERPPEPDWKVSPEIWREWAKGEIVFWGQRAEESRTSFGRLLTIKEEMEQHIRQKEEALAEKTRAIEGLQTWLRTKKASVEVLEIGTEVAFVREESRKGLIEGVSIRRGGVVYYHLVWWEQGSRRIDWVHTSEIFPVHDLPHPAELREYYSS